MALLVNISRGDPERVTVAYCGKNVCIDFTLTPPTRRRNLGITHDWSSGKQMMHFGPPEFDVVDVYCRIVKLCRALTSAHPEYISVTVTEDKDFWLLKRENFAGGLRLIFKENWPVEQINEKIRLTGEDENERICRQVRAFEQK